MVLDTLQLSPMFFKFLCPMRKQICVILLFGGGLREGWDSTYKRVLLHRIKHVTKSYKKKVRWIISSSLFLCLKLNHLLQVPSNAYIQIFKPTSLIGREYWRIFYWFFSFIVFYVGLSRFCCYLFYILFHPSSRFGVLCASPFLCRGSAFINHFHWITC